MSTEQGQAGPPQWMIDTFNATVQALMEGTATACEHVVAGRTNPIVAVAWKPGIVSCVGCAQQMFSCGDKERCCDFCGLDVSDGEPLMNMQLRHGALFFAAAVCVHCAPDDVLTADQRAFRDRSRAGA